MLLSVAYIGPNSRTQRPTKTKIGTEVAHVTCDSDNTFKVKRSKVKVTKPLWLVVLAGQHGHTVMVTSPYACMMSPLAGLGGGHIVAAARLQLVKCSFVYLLFCDLYIHQVVFSDLTPLDEMTYTVSSGTLNSNIPYHRWTGSRKASWAVQSLSGKFDWMICK